MADIFADNDEPQYVCTPDFEDAADRLEDQGQVVLCGPPGCGKTTLANALLRRCQRNGFTSYTIPCLEKLDEDVLVGRSAVLLDCSLGTVRVDRQQYELWQRMRSAMVDKGCLRLIIALYPHVLREVRLLEGGIHSPLSDPCLVVQVGSCLNRLIREKMLRFHLKKLPLESAELDQLTEAILQVDRSGRGFPWCCHYLVEHWQCSKDPAIFCAPEETDAILTGEMVAHDSYGKQFAAVLVLTIQGFHSFSNTPLQAQPILTDLGFGEHKDDDLAEHADVLCGSILTESGEGFNSRVLYDAAALAVGRSFHLSTMLRVCDVSFLVQHVRTAVVAEEMGGKRKSKLVINVGLSTGSCASRPLETTPKDLQTLTEKVCQEIMSGHLPEICQHPSLQCSEFLLALEQYCQTHSGNHSVQQLVSILDCEHHLPLVYWSVFNRRDTLTQWCLKHMTQTKSGLDLLSPPVLLACAVFDQLAGSSTSRLQPLLQDAFPSKHFNYQTLMVELPLLRRGRCLTPESRDYHDAITGTGPNQRKLHYLCDASLSIPAEVMSIQLSGEKAQVQVRFKQRWYLLHRLLADREADGRDWEGNTLLHLATNMGDRVIIQLAVKSGGSVLEKNGKGETAYQVAQGRQAQLWQRYYSSAAVNVSDYFNAIYKGDDEKVKTLLCYCIGVHDKDRHGDTGLHAACWAGQEDIADFLIQLGADVGTKNNDRRTPLYYAYRSNRSSLVSLLVQAGAEVSEVHQTVVQGDVDALRTFIQQGAEVNQRDPSMECSPLHIACLMGHSDLVTCLVQHGAHVNAVDGGSCSPVHQACRRGHTQIVQYLISQGADVNASNSNKVTPLHISSQEGHTETALCLIHSGAHVNAENSHLSTPLHAACWNGHRHTAVSLIAHDASVNAEDSIRSTPLHVICRTGDHQTARLLVEHGARVNAEELDQSTPLHFACRNGFHQVAEFLMEHGANVNAVDTTNSTPLHKACVYGDHRTALCLIQHGAIVNAENNIHATPLHVACGNGRHRTAVSLIEHGANVNTVYPSCPTPLHIACVKGDHHIALYLIQHGANVNTVTSTGFTPLHFAMKFRRDNIVQLLTQYGGRSDRP